MSNPTCETCRWWNGTRTVGDCRRYPEPKLKKFDYWCGEHQPRKPLPVVELKADGKLHFHVSGNNVWRADAGTYRFQIAKEGEEHYTATMHGYDLVAWGSYETAVAWCEAILSKYGN